MRMSFVPGNKFLESFFRLNKIIEFLLETPREKWARLCFARTKCTMDNLSKNKLGIGRVEVNMNKINEKMNNCTCAKKQHVHFIAVNRFNSRIDRYSG